jgi:hypothetical protein
MFTQVELISTKQEVRVYWLEHEQYNHAPIRVGRGVRILEELPYFSINRVFTTLKNRTDLPVKSLVGTIVELN